MKCPYCGFSSNKVVDKRSVNGTGEIRRRRECLKCHLRFTTYERLFHLELMVIKKDGRHEPFIREKLRSGILKALEKRPTIDKAEGIAERIESKLRLKGEKEVNSRLIGKMVLTELKKTDFVAYLRFASVYRDFGSKEDFMKALTTL